MSVQEDLKSHDLVGLLLSIAREGESGILTVQGHDEIIALSFLEGRVVSADALNQPLEDGLGQILSDESLVSPEDFTALAGEYHAGGGRVVDLLVERRFVTQEQLLDTLRLHYYQLCRQVLGWADGEFKFYQGDEISYEEGVEALAVEEVMVRVALDAASDSSPLKRMPRLESIFERTDQNPPESDPASALAELVGPDLSSKDPGRDALSLLERVDGIRQAEALALASGLDKYIALFTLYRLQESDFVRVIQAPQRSEEVADSVGSSAQRPEEVVVPSEVAQFPSDKWEETDGPEIIETTLPPLLGDSDDELGEFASNLELRDRTGSRVPRETKGQLAGQVAGLLAAGLAATLVFLVATSPGRFLVPLDQQEELRLEMENDRRASVYLKIDRAAKTFFLLDGLFPSDLETLVERRLLSVSDIRTSEGETLVYSASPAGYRIGRLATNSEDPDDEVFTESIDGNFLLDPEFVIRDDRDIPPLVLLD